MLERAADLMLELATDLGRGADVQRRVDRRRRDALQAGRDRPSATWYRERCEDAAIEFAS
jgi:hypothetical protein